MRSPVTENVASPDDKVMFRRVVQGAVIGNIVEWYDFAIYGYLATMLAAHFFPAGNETAALLSTFAIFAAAFFVRPLGALVLGPMRERFGLRRLLSAVILTSSAAAMAIGLLPGYEDIGVAAPILLLVLRCIQGFAAGGEYGGGAVLLAEHAADSRRGFAVSLMGWSATLGFLLGSIVVTLLEITLPAAVMESVGWRIPFLLAGPLGLVGLYLRLRLRQETPLFSELHAEPATAPSALTVIATSWRAILRLIGMLTVSHLSFYIVFTFLPTYFIKTLNFDRSDTFISTTIASMVTLVLVLPLARLSDRIGRRPMIITGTLAMAVLAYPLFIVMHRTGFAGAAAAQTALAILESIFISSTIAAGVEMFGTRDRYTGFSIGYNISAALFGGTAPYVAIWLVDRTGNSMAPGLYVAAAAVISLLCVVGLRDMARQPLPTVTGQRS